MRVPTATGRHKAIAKAAKQIGTILPILFPSDIMS